MGSVWFYVMVTVALQINLYLVFEGMENSVNKELINKHSNHFDSNQCVLWCKCNLGLVQAGDPNCICLNVCAILLINSILQEVVFVVRSNPCLPQKNTLNITQGLFSLPVKSSQVVFFVFEQKKKPSTLSGKKCQI